MISLQQKTAIILFDLDGTLIDSTQAIYMSFCEAYKTMCAELPAFECVKNSIGHTLEDMFVQNGVARSEVQEYVKAYRIHYRVLMEEGTHLLPFAKEAIIKAYEFANLGIVTTKRGDFSQILLQKLGVWEYFDDIIGIESVRFPKPHTEPILKALEHLGAAQKGINNHKIFMIGDTSLDLSAAKNAHINAVGVLCGFGKRDDMESFNVPLCENTLAAVHYIAQKCGV
ncbi:HAD family hydrolase [Helicobacter sp. MIT 21-1697]|uniref:HAD family hydrolase n=1 Tax=Helicobacter sp. MIT 21-1697 TaxID=2993733 RepID=UPI00224AA733|nr:HAD family hydrolase [Helicobacter sp. MIT 21-1697]MCX2716537.1 HAD family hydrolase [Helicobacter sp. MIT 21-1697]